MANLNELLPKLYLRWFLSYTYSEAEDEMYKISRKDNEDFLDEREYIEAYITYLEEGLRNVADQLTKTIKVNNELVSELYDLDQEIVQLKRHLHSPLAPMLGGGGSKKRIKGVIDD